MKNVMLAGLCALGMSLAACEEDEVPPGENDAAIDEPTGEQGSDAGSSGGLDASVRTDAGASDGGSAIRVDGGGADAGADPGANPLGLPGLEDLFGDGGILSGLPDPTTVIDELTGDGGLAGLIPGLGDPPPEDAGTTTP